MIAWGLMSTKHPLLVHIIPVRRCNLACTYCNEFDDFSKPVPIEELKKRLDHLADLGTAVVTISGGEPLLHPELDEFIAHIRRRGMIAGLITNGYLLTAERIHGLNRAGLEHLQISIDNVKPDDVSKKSLKVLDQKLKLLADHAIFQVNINSVLGSGVADSEDALAIAQRALGSGIHEHGGNYSRWARTIASAGAARSRNFQENSRAREAFVFAIQRISNEYRGRQAKRMAMPLGLAIFVHLRGWIGALVLAAARASGNAARGIHARRCEARVLHKETVRAAVHRFVRATNFDH